VVDGAIAHLTDVGVVEIQPDEDRQDCQEEQADRAQKPELGP
jgi:hypothetical protein